MLIKAWRKGLARWINVLTRDSVYLEGDKGLFFMVI